MERVIAEKELSTKTKENESNNLKIILVSSDPAQKNE